MPNLSGCSTGAGLSFRTIRPLIAAFSYSFTSLPLQKGNYSQEQMQIVSPESDNDKSLFYSSLLIIISLVDITRWYLDEIGSSIFLRPVCYICQRRLRMQRILQQGNSAKNIRQPPWLTICHKTGIHQPTFGAILDIEEDGCSALRANVSGLLHSIP